MRLHGIGWVAALAASMAGCGASGDADYAARMAAEHAGDRPVAAAAAAPDPAVVAIEEASVVYARLDGTAVTGFLARPPGPTAGKPGILVIQEWWGLNDNIRAMARRLAGDGYVALAVDLYEGKVAEDPERARELMSAAMEREARLEENLRGAWRYLKDDLGAGRTGTIGWCFGGGWSLRAALALGDGIDATVIYYGRLVTDAGSLAALRAPVLGIFGSVDQGIPLESVREFERALQELGKPAEIHVYEGASHAFANPSGTAYDAEAAEDAWEKTRAFLGRHLRSAAEATD
jgi:carboxymethylenebutenolidase